jgi:hypothetical protein
MTGLTTRFRAGAVTPQFACPARQQLVSRERSARLGIAAAERNGTQIPLGPIAVFLRRQRARWAHEESCDQCRDAGQ